MVGVRHMLQVAPYARISDTDEERAPGIDRQLRTVLPLIESRGGNPTDEYIDNDKSAYQEDVIRDEGFEPWLADFIDGKNDGIAALDLDRIFRQPADLERVIKAYKVAVKRGRPKPVLWTPSLTLDLTDEERTAKFRPIALALTALEARYFPKLDAEWLHLNNTDEQEWGQYRQAFDPVAMSRMLNYPAERVRQDAEWLLFRARQLDPLGNSWSRLVRRAPSSKWKDLKNDALLAMDYRIAAEMLLLFYEDIADRAEPLPDVAHLHERLSYRERTLDQDLMGLGISPHPRVVLAVEGETEQEHVPGVWKELDYPDAPELMRLLMLEGTTKDLVKVAALAAAPLVAGKHRASVLPGC